MNKYRILIADDDRTLRMGIFYELEEAGYRVWEAASVPEVMELLRENSFHLILTDLKIPKFSDGMQIITETKKYDENIMVLVMTGYGTIEVAVQAIQAGADDFVTKDSPIEEIKLKIERLLEQQQLKVEHQQIQEENERLRSQLEERYRFDNLIGNSDNFREMLKLVGKVADDGQCTVLLQGESGTGKELVARAIHYNSPRQNKPFVIVNIAAVPETLLESELFGHVKGAFTDAVKDRIGKFKMAEGGTLFLDEIGDLPFRLQSRLLRFLQERTFEPVGSDTVLSTDVRIIAATNKDLSKEVSEKTFRKDLFYRLNVVPIFLPPLRERKIDIPILADHFLKKYAGPRGKSLKSDKELVNRLMEYYWPGNIRELENVVEQMVVLAAGKILRLDDLPRHVRSSFEVKTMEKPAGNQSFNEARRILIQQFEKQYLRQALQKNSWNVSRTAREIGLSREGLHRMIKRYQLKKESEL